MIHRHGPPRDSERGDQDETRQLTVVVVTETDTWTPLIVIGVDDMKIAMNPAEARHFAVRVMDAAATVERDVLLGKFLASLSGDPVVDRKMFASYMEFVTLQMEYPGGVIFREHDPDDPEKGDEDAG